MQTIRTRTQSSNYTDPYPICWNCNAKHEHSCTALSL